MSTHRCSKHVEDSNKHTIEETVRQVGYLPELYEDARPEKYKNIVHCSFWYDGFVEIFINYFIVQNSLHNYKLFVLQLKALRYGQLLRDRLFWMQ